MTENTEMGGRGAKSKTANTGGGAKLYGVSRTDAQGLTQHHDVTIPGRTATVTPLKGGGWKVTHEDGTVDTYTRVPKAAVMARLKADGITVEPA